MVYLKVNKFLLDSIICEHKIFIEEGLLLKLFCSKIHMKVGRINDENKKILFSFIALSFGIFLFVIFVHYQFMYSLPIQFAKFEEYPFTGIILRLAEITSIKLNDDKRCLC